MFKFEIGATHMLVVAKYTGEQERQHRLVYLFPVSEASEQLKKLEHLLEEYRFRIKYSPNEEILQDYMNNLLHMVDELIQCDSSQDREEKAEVVKRLTNNAKVCNAILTNVYDLPKSEAFMSNLEESLRILSLN